MNKPWITRTDGPEVIQTGVPATFRVGSYKETEGVDLDAVYWKLYVQEGQDWRELKGEKHKGAVTTFIFTKTDLIGKPILVEAYGSNPEISSPPGKIVELQQGPVTIESIGLYDINGNSITEPLKYGQTLLARIMTVNMIGETLGISLWERDTFSDIGHDAEENQKLWTGSATVPRSGEVKVKIPLTPAMAQQANNNWNDRNTHEYYLLVENDITLNRYSIQTVEVDNEVLENAPSTPDVSDATSSLDPGVGTLTPPTTTPPSTPSIPPSHPPATVSQGTTVPVQGLGTDPPRASGNSVQTVNLGEAIVEAYFAKDEMGPTDEAAGTVSYEIQNPTRDKSIETIAKEIKDIVDPEQQPNDKYVKLDKLIEKLNIIAERNDLPWPKGTNIGVPLFKLGPVMTKVSSAPLDSKLYLVADTQGMDGDVLKVQILEKDGLIQGNPDAVLPALFLNVAQMEEDTTSSDSEEAEGVQQTQFIATVENNQIAIPIHLRPKKNEELTQWQEKIQKGVKDEYQHTYTASSRFTVDDADELDQIAQTITERSNNDSTIQEKGLRVYKEDVVEILRPQPPEEFGEAEYSQVTGIPTYKKLPELLYLKATPQPSDTLDEFFLNEDENSYFLVGGGNCFCNRDFTENELKTIVKKIRDNTYYFDEDANTNFNVTYYHQEKLFHLYTNVPSSDQNFTKFAEVLNKAFNKHGISKCLHKIHFLANMYVETMYFTTTREGSGTSGFRYDPYRGRGFQHLTLKSNYEKYKDYSGIDVVNNYEIVADDLNISADSGAWYWALHNINRYAEQDSIFDTARLINLPGATSSSQINGYENREAAWIELKNIFRYPQACNNTEVSTNSNVNIHFLGESAHEYAVSQSSRNLLKDVGETTNNMDIYITSTARTPYDQARIMYNNCLVNLGQQRRVYAPPGQRVIDVFVANRSQSRDTVISLMERKIIELGPSNVSKHCADHNVLNVMDISISRLSNPNDFFSELLNRSEVSKALDENGCYHIEIPQ